VDGYLAALRSARWWARAAAAENIGLAGAKRATSKLVAALEDEVPEVRLRAAKALGLVGGSAAVLPLLKALSEPNRWSTIRIADILADMGRDVVRELIEAFPKLNGHGRLAALDILGRIHSLDAAPWLLARLADPEPDVRARAAHALGAIGVVDAAPPLRAALSDTEWPVRAMAAKALGRIHDAEAIPRLCAALRDREWWVRANAAESLKLAGPMGIEALEGMLADEDLYAKHQACLMLDESGILDRRVAQLASNGALTDAAEWVVVRFVHAGQTGGCASWRRRTRTRRYGRPRTAAFGARGAGGRRVNWTVVLQDALIAFNAFVLVYFIALNSIYLALSDLAVRGLKFVRRTFFSDYRQIMQSDMTWPISVLIPAHDEEKTIVETVRSMLMVNYGEFEIIVVNDGSNDSTLARSIEAYELRRTTVRTSVRSPRRRCARCTARSRTPT
jgi:HEAT repeat protein